MERLLELLAPAVWPEPGLLRAIRCLLPEGRLDAGFEARVWQHAAVASQSSVAAAWDADARKTYQARFASLPESERRAVLDRIRHWRANVHPAIWFEEVLGLDEQTRHRLLDADDVEDALAFITVISKAVWQ